LTIFVFLQKGDKEPSKNYKLTKTSEQVTDAFRYFLDGHAEALVRHCSVVDITLRERMLLTLK